MVILLVANQLDGDAEVHMLTSRLGGRMSAGFVFFIFLFMLGFVFFKIFFKFFYSFFLLFLGLKFWWMRFNTICIHILGPSITSPIINYLLRYVELRLTGSQHFFLRSSISRLLLDFEIRLETALMRVKMIVDDSMQIFNLVIVRVGKSSRNPSIWVGIFVFLQVTHFI